ncbi:MAG TPA: MotA/TolQ/ExbB proton channel family protein [Candidatus Limnocylindria bacterium]|nr:MotA/TolQ/ExbB proton channel family protein [Candidatus Limnocylindria bacterium]
MVLGALILQLGGGVRASVPALVAQSGLFAKIILVILLAMSVYSWAVIWNRMRLYSRVEKSDRTFLGSFRRVPKNADFRLVCEQHPNSLLARVALVGQRTLEQHPADAGSPALRYEIAQRAMDRAANEETSRLERHVGFLATTGSVSPFIGLMGTVWGVMTAFLNIGAQGSASLVVVAPGIAEALIATVAGLAAAIPAVVGYNHLLGRLREFANVTGQFVNEFLDQRLGGRGE